MNKTKERTNDGRVNKIIVKPYSDRTFLKIFWDRGRGGRNSRPSF